MPHRHIRGAQAHADNHAREHEDYNHLKIHRLNEDAPTDKSHHLLAALVETHVGEPIPIRYHGPSVFYVVEGEFHGVDPSKPGEVIRLVQGDVLHVDHDSFLTWTSPNKGKVFAAAYVPTHIQPEDFAIKK